MQQLLNKPIAEKRTVFSHKQYTNSVVNSTYTQDTQTNGTNQQPITKENKQGTSYRYLFISLWVLIYLFRLGSEKIKLYYNPQYSYYYPEYNHNQSTYSNQKTTMSIFGYNKPNTQSTKDLPIAAFNDSLYNRKTVVVMYKEETVDTTDLGIYSIRR